MNLDQLIQIAANHGVAIAIAIYLVYWITNHLNERLYRIEQKLDEIARTNKELLEKLLDLLEKK